MENTTDYLVLGGGLAGCALASRLKEYLPDARVTLVEAGPNEHNNPMITDPMSVAFLHNTPLEYNYRTVPQKDYDGRQVYHSGGKVLSGSSCVNYAAWTRGDRADYDQWAKVVGDDRWSYERMLPYFCKTETHHDASADPTQHGFTGPIHTKPALSRSYGLTPKLFAAYRSLGIAPNDDTNSGDNKGIAPYIENWRNGKRQPAGVAYGLKGVEVLTNSVIKRVLLQDGPDGEKTAVGAELVSGRIIKAVKEVILSCGAIRTPQVLMLSGIGPAKELASHGIKHLVEAPDVGQNFHEHLAYTQFYKIKNPEQGFCAPHPNFKHPTFGDGIPTDYVIFQSASSSKVKAALERDGEEVTALHPYLHPPRSHYEIIPMYSPCEVPLTDLDIPLDGSVLSIGVLNVLPTSRGSITLQSADPTDHPLIDPNYFATETDRVVIREALRTSMAALESSSGVQTVEHEIAPKGYPQLTSHSTDEEIDARVKRAAGTFFHGAGTASMGKVVDSECRVKGVQGLSVVDASVLPIPLSAHYQVPLYALAEQMAELIAARQTLPRA